MYTVVRFCADESCSDRDLMGVGARLNELVRDAFGHRLDHAGRRFSVSVSKNADWNANLAETMGFIRKVMPLIEAARLLGIHLEADAAIEPDDVRNRPWLTCGVPPEISAELARAGIWLAITIYPG